MSNFRTSILSTAVKSLVLATTMIFSSGLSAQRMLDLHECLLHALEHNTNVRKAGMDQDAARYVVKEATAEGLPQITGQLDVNMFPSIATQILPGEIIGQPGTQVPVQFGTKYSSTVGGRVTQILYDQRFLTGLRAAKASEELYGLLHLQTEEQVIHEVASAFYQILELRAQQAGIDSQLVMMTELERITDVQVQNQFKRKVDLQRVQVNRQNAMTERDALALSSEQQVNYLKVLMGMPVDEQIEIARPDDLGIKLPTQNYTPLYGRRTDIKVIEEQLVLQDLQIKSTRAGYLPTLSAFASYNYQAQRNTFDFLDMDQIWFKTSQVGVTLAIPVFDGLRKSARIGQQKVQLLQQQADLEYTGNALAMEERNAIAELRTTWKNVEAQASNLVLATEVYDQTNMMYTEGVSPLTDLLDADESLRVTRTAYYRAMLRYKLAELELLKAQGGLKTLLT